MAALGAAYSWRVQGMAVLTQLGVAREDAAGHSSVDTAVGEQLGEAVGIINRAQPSASTSDENRFAAKTPLTSPQKGLIIEEEDQDQDRN